MGRETDQARRRVAEPRRVECEGDGAAGGAAGLAIWAELGAGGLAGGLLKLAVPRHVAAPIEHGGLFSDDSAVEGAMAGDDSAASQSSSRNSAASL